MAANATNEQSEEFRIKEIAHELIIILNQSRQPNQITRIQRDLDALNERYRRITDMSLADVLSDMSDEESGGQKTSKLIARIRIERASPHCESHDINMISSIIKEFETNYWNILSERHLKLDYTNSAERDTFFTKMEELKRNLKLVVNYIEESAETSSQEYLQRLRNLRAKQERLLLLEYRDFFSELSDFLGKLVANMDENGAMVLNNEDQIMYSKMDGEPYFEGKTVEEAVRDIYEFSAEAETAIQLPDL